MLLTLFLILRITISFKQISSVVFTFWLFLDLFFLFEVFLDNGVLGSQLLEQLRVVVDDLNTVFIPVGTSKLLSEHFIVHHSWSHLFSLLHAPENYTDEIQIIIRKHLQVPLILAVLEAVVKSDDSRTEKVFNWLTKVLSFDKPMDLSLKRTVLLFHFLLVILFLLFIVVTAFLDSNEEFKFFSEFSENSIFKSLQFSE